MEGLAVIASVGGQTLLLASSQGDSSFHSYVVNRTTALHLGTFFVDGVGETDSVHYAPVPLGPQFPLGLLVVQNGEAPEPPTPRPSTATSSTAPRSSSTSASSTPYQH
ncbi:MAG TPA: phytase [Vicinamibacterales bacterium]|nr:phytase [Vicinamibacterales bacterium]